MKGRKKSTTERNEQLLIKLSESVKNTLLDISNERRKAKAPNKGLSDIAFELINEGLKTIKK